MASDVLDKIKAGWETDNNMQKLIQSVKDKSYHGDKVTFDDGLLRRKGKIMVAITQQ